MKRYRLQTEDGCSDEFETLEQIMSVFENWKDNIMSEGVYAGETFVEIQESGDGFETHKVIKRDVAVVDEDQTKDFGTPEENGCEWAYWAKWEEVKV